MTVYCEAIGAPCELRCATCNEYVRNRQAAQTPEHYFVDGDRCKCGGLVVYHEDTSPPGHGCEVEGKPWSAEVRDKDPMARLEGYMP